FYPSNSTSASYKVNYPKSWTASPSVGTDGFTIRNRKSEASGRIRRHAKTNENKPKILPHRIPTALAGIPYSVSPQHDSASPSSCRTSSASSVCGHPLRWTLDWTLGWMFVPRPPPPYVLRFTFYTIPQHSAPNRGIPQDLSCQTVSTQRRCILGLPGYTIQ